MFKVDIHADDYGYSLNTSKDILDCLKQGCLDSISIICNTKYFDESMELMYKEIPNLASLPLMSIHLNLVEGNMTTGMLPMSWAKLFIHSYWFDRNKIKNIIKQELKYQIDKTQEAINKCIDIANINNVEVKQKAIRLDSHVHTHLLPVVFSALIELIEEEKYDIEYIRNPLEPINPFFRETKLLGTYSFVNIIKNRILAFYSKKVDNYCEQKKLAKMYMWGLIMSSHMDFARIKVIYPKMVDKACKDDRALELLFHPGKADQNEYSIEMNENYFRDFNSIDNRHIEKDAVLKMKELYEQE